MVKLRLAAAAALLTAALLGAFGSTAQANHDPACWEDYVACIASGTHPGDCNCTYQMCIGGWCD